MVLFWSGSILMPSWHATMVPLRSEVAMTVAVDIILDSVITSVTLNWKGVLEISRPWSRGRIDWIIPRDGTLHWCATEGIVHVKVTLSPGHGFSTLDCNWAPETEKEQCCCSENNTLQSLVFALVNITEGTSMITASSYVDKMIQGSQLAGQKMIMLLLYASKLYTK